MKTNYKYLTAVLGSLLLAGAAMGADNKNDEQKNNGHNDAFVNGPAGQSKIAEEVRHQLVTLPYFGVFDDMAFRVDGSTVTLLGQVVRPTLKSDAEAAVKHIDGVTKVVNNIEVLPLSPNDDSIRRATYAAIYGDPSISARYGYRAVPSIHIIVKNGNIKLEGVVANEGDKDLINIKVNGVPNAFKVQNDLQVEPKQ